MKRLLPLLVLMILSFLLLVGCNPSDTDPNDGAKPSDPEAMLILMENGVKFYHSGGGGIRIVGTKGEFNHGANPQLRPLKAVNVRRYSGGADNIADDFLYCVRHRTRPFQDVFYGANVSDYGHMCIIAYKLKRHLVWDKEKMEFVGDREATAMVSKVQRAPYQIEV
jgi:hypothetical protein